MGVCVEAASMWPCKVAFYIRRHGEDSILARFLDTLAREYRNGGTAENFRNFYDPLLPIKRKLNDSMANPPIEKE